MLLPRECASEHGRLISLFVQLPRENNETPFDFSGSTYSDIAHAETALPCFRPRSFDSYYRDLLLTNIYVPCQSQSSACS